MADTSVTFKDASGATVPVDGFSQSGGDVRQAVVIGDPGAANAAAVNSNGALSVAVANTSVPVTVGNTVPVTVGNTVAVTVGNTPVPVTVGNTSVPVTVGNASLPVTVAGNVAVTPAAPTAADRTVVSASVTDKQIVASNSARLGLTIWNNSTAILYLGFGSTTSPTVSNATVPIPAQGYYEMPFNWRGSLRGVWASANGSAVVTELS